MVEIIDETFDWRSADDITLGRAVEWLWSTRTMTTAGIAAFLRVPEARVWNVRCRADARQPVAMGA
jgi:hypothetical protein